MTNGNQIEPQQATAIEIGQIDRNPIEIEYIDDIGYAASTNPITSLQTSIGEPCNGHDKCALRGDLIPELLSAADGVRAAARIARAKALISGQREYGHLHLVKIQAKVLAPSPPITEKMGTIEGADIWNALRPFAAERAFDGIRFPFGILIFRVAQDGFCIQEQHMWRISSDGEPLDE